MFRTIVIKLENTSATAVVVRAGADGAAIEFATTLPVAPGSVQAAGAQLGEALAPYRSGRTPVIAAVPRPVLVWQTNELPPAPEEDLPDLVRMQMQRDVVVADDALGSNFLPLGGGMSGPWRVLAVAMQPAEWKRLHDFCEAAQLKLDRAVPEPFGWPALVSAAAASSAHASDELKAYVAVGSGQAVLWASRGPTICLFRTVVAGSDHDGSSDASQLAGELRRTLAALAQSEGVPADCVVVGDDPAALAAALESTLGRPVTGLPLRSFLSATGEAVGQPLVGLAPLAGLGAAEAKGLHPPLDLAHPRRRPAPPSRKRTFSLAAGAAAAIAALFSWSVYRNLQQPLDEAAAAEAELKLIEPELEARAKDETRAAAIGAWLAEAPSLLVQLDDASQGLRPKPTSAPDYPVAQDLMATKLVASAGKTTLSTVARTSEALPPAEERLRKEGYNVDRGPVEFNSTAAPNYPVSVPLVLGRAAPAAASKEASR